MRVPRKSLTAVAAIGAAALALAGCSSSSSGGSSPAASGAASQASASTPSSKPPAGLSVPNIPAATAVGDGEGALNIIVWAGYAEDGTDRQERRLGPPVRGQDRLQGQRQGRQHLRRDGQPDEDRPVRRGVRLRRRHAAAHLRRQRRAGQHRPRPELRRRSPTSSRTRRGTRSTARCTASRTVGAPTSSCGTRKIVTTAPDVLELGLRREQRRTRARSPPTTHRSTSLTPRCT